MFAQLQLMIVVWTILISLVLYVVYEFYIKPYLSIIYDKKQGGVSTFHWKLISYFDDYQNALKSGDFFSTFKDLVRKNPQAKFIVDNFASRAHIIPTDPEMIKEVLRRYCRRQ